MIGKHTAICNYIFFYLIQTVATIALGLFYSVVAMAETFGVMGGECVKYARIQTADNDTTSPPLGSNGGAYLIFDNWNYGFGRGPLPAVGSLLVIEKTPRLNTGHVGIVRGIITKGNEIYELRVDESNWYLDQKITTDVRYRYDQKNLTINREFTPPANRSGTQNSPFGATSYPVRGFVYTENSPPPPLEQLTKCTNAIKSTTPKPLATAIVFDKSGSMADERKIDYAREASFTYAREMKAEDLLSLSTFSNDAVTPAGLEIKNKTEISPRLAEILPTLRPDGQTNIGAGLTSGLKQLCSVPSDQVKKGALLLSDGMNNIGSYEAVVTEYRNLAIPIYTVKFGQEASEKDLRDIAAKTSGIYMDSDTTNLTDAYRYIYAAINGDSVRIASHDPMGPKDSLAYEVDVSPDARALQIGTSWQGSRLKTVLTSPSGATYTANRLPNQADRFETGPITQFTQINAPESGRWQIDLTWDNPPPAAERVNLFVSEHSDVYASLYGFSPEYSPGQQVTMNVHAAELDGGNNKIPLKNARVRARVQIPGPEVIRLIQAQGANVRISENISQEIYREVELFDDGQHADYNESDGIFGGIFTETQLKGPYIVSAHIEGERTNGAYVSRDSRGAFHVGSLMDNGVFTSDLMRYAQQLEERMKTKVTNPLGKMQGNPASDIEIPANGEKTQSRSLMDSISN